MDTFMIGLAALGGLLFSILAPVAAQERLASVGLKDGRTLAGRVLSMNLKSLNIEVGDKVLKVPTSLIRDCRLQEPIDFTPTSKGQSALKPGKTAAVGSQQPAPAPLTESGAGVDKLVAGSKDSSEASSEALSTSVSLDRPDAVLADEHRSLIRRRIGSLDRAYPWLVPGAPSQWVSLAAMLLLGLGLMVHMSVYVAGGEKSHVGRSMALGVWYLVSGLAQVAMVPVNDPSIVVMIMLNSTLSLFGLAKLFGLPRIGATIALMVQLGVAVLVFGILELVTALLGSVGGAL